MNSEKRDKLLQVPENTEQRRAASADRRQSSPLKRALSPPPISIPSMSAPDVLSPQDSEPQQKPQPPPQPQPQRGGLDSNIPAGARQVDYGADDSVDFMSGGGPPPLSVAGDSFLERRSTRSASDVDDTRLQEELEAKWILNLSMHFRDLSDREKFFITFAEEPNKWRRVTVSCDYRNLAPDSLEADLKSLHYQRDKSSRIYEAIRDSLPAIQFYETVTNLKLQTDDGRLHVHVTEDVNEIIPYPSLSAVEHLRCQQFRESAISFDSHISGFVYKVSARGRVYIKKEIPGPDAVEEFLYEINALASLQESKSVIKFEGIIVDEKDELIKGLLISYADQGALVDMLYDYKHDPMEWRRRERWAMQIVEGLSEIHEAGFVQGDFTLSNIVIDHDDNAKIIDINRRGCPVGWEPPELARLIESGQRISIYIGVKSDLFQLGMVLWALAQHEDEPERQPRPLEFEHGKIPEYFRDISVSTHRSDKEYIDPATAVDLDDISNHHRHSRSRSSFSHVNMPSTDYIGSSSSYDVISSSNVQRGRSPGDARNNSGTRRSDGSPFAGPRSIMSLDDSEMENELASLPASRDTRWEQVYVDGDTKLVHRGAGDIDVQDFARQEPKDVCITTPPEELENTLTGSKNSDDTQMALSTGNDFQHLPPYDTSPKKETGHRRGIGNKASFSDRVHQLNSSHSPNINTQIPNSATLADLQDEIALDSSVTSSAYPSRTSTAFPLERAETGVSFKFGRPVHQDSGFNEPERTSYESERIRQSLDMTMADIARAREQDQRVNERLWDEKDGTMIGEGVRGDQLVIQPPTPQPLPPTSARADPKSGVGPRGIVPVEDAAEKALEEKISNTTIRPPSILIPELLTTVPRLLPLRQASPRDTWS
ncbi:hypothetical protein BS50DRAFT_599647 [Corynespora cassiicola Philippines]|uniref:Protein kinase domain-containing protein n=1 Tax=Corynespora cassiicola Philippines TaxID=1448308 RepID=A0A2T2NVE2_CORCC|nr:hypothetical protein BS50DRAFT_599647 [Corynespora cassiicola Philippines]